jgi:UDPglucose 6-dehydrogenase
MLLEEHARVAIYDPKAMKECKKDLAGLDQSLIEYCKCPYEAAKGAHAVLILTEWKEFKAYDYAKILESMQKPAFIFDGRNILDHDALYKMGYNVFAIGKAAKSHLK